MNTSNRSQSPRRSSLARRTCIGLALTLGLALPAVAAWADEGDDLPPIVGQVTEGSMCDSAAVTLLVSASSKDVWVYTAAGRVQLLDRSLVLAMPNISASGVTILMSSGAWEIEVSPEDADAFALYTFSGTTFTVPRPPTGTTSRYTIAFTPINTSEQSGKVPTVPDVVIDSKTICPPDPLDPVTPNG